MKQPSSDPHEQARHVKTPDSPEFERHLDLYRVLTPMARLVLQHRYNYTADGEEYIPNGSAIVVANHLRVEDSPLIALVYSQATGRPLRFGAKKEYFEGRGLAKPGEPPRFGRSMKWLIEHTGMIPVDREAHTREAFESFSAAVGSRLAVGDSVALHPEGTRSLDSRLHRFHTGAARLALQFGVPLIPAGIVYTNVTGQKKQAAIHFGEPLYLGEPSRLVCTASLVAVTAELEARVADLTGQKRSGVYAAIPRAFLPKSDTSPTESLGADSEA